MASREEIKAGTILHGPMEGVEHGKFYVIAGAAVNEIFVCSVMINSVINPFIEKRPKLLKRQILIKCADYNFLDYDSYVNCAQPLKIKSSQFFSDEYAIKDHLRKADLETIVSNIIASGSLSKYDIDTFFKL